MINLTYTVAYDPGEMSFNHYDIMSGCDTDAGLNDISMNWTGETDGDYAVTLRMDHVPPNGDCAAHFYFPWKQSRCYTKYYSEIAKTRGGYDTSYLDYYLYGAGVG